MWDCVTRAAGGEEDGDGDDNDDDYRNKHAKGDSTRPIELRPEMAKIVVMLSVMVAALF